MADALALVAAGLAASTAVHMLVLPLLPPRVCEEASRWRMRLRLRLWPARVDMEMVSKAAAAEGGPAEPAGDVRERVAASMREAGFGVTSGGPSLNARVPVGRRALSLSVRWFCSKFVPMGLPLIDRSRAADVRYSSRA